MMVYRPAGLDPQEIDQAFKAFYSAKSVSDFESLIANLPVTRTPYFHAMMNQECIRLVNDHSDRLDRDSFNTTICSFSFCMLKSILNSLTRQ